MHSQNKPNNITSNKKDGTKKTLNAPWILQIFLYSIEKGCCKYLQQALHKSKSKWEKERRVGEEWERFEHSNNTLRIDV